jgi:hypothetical protein
MRVSPIAAAILCACGDVATDELLRPPMFAGDAMPNPDAAAAALDASPFDAGRRDAGPRDGGTPFDGGRPDTGLHPSGDEGQPCFPDAPESCRWPATTCVRWSPENSTEPIVASCVRECVEDFECADSQIGPHCRSVLFGMKACVADGRGAGEVIEPTLRHGGPMTGCGGGGFGPDLLQAIPRTAGSFLSDLEDDQLSCAQRCDDTQPCATGPYCARNLLPDPPDGICQRRQAKRGARCSMRSAVEMCDASSGAFMVCVDAGLYAIENQDPDLEFGICLEICTQQDPTCRSEGDPNHVAQCEFGLINAPDLGVCDDNCSAFPDDCTGPGSPPIAGHMQRGATCFQINGTAQAPEVGLCIDVAQDGALLDVWDFVSTPEPCADMGARCPDGSHCAPVDQANSGACVIGCDTQGMPTGCEGAAQPMCQSAFGGTAGVCR